MDKTVGKFECFLANIYVIFVLKLKSYDKIDNINMITFANENFNIKKHLQPLLSTPVVQISIFIFMPDNRKWKEEKIW